ncbi:MAG: hypothetical protein AAGF32_09715, partial [Pseudomonadota bacterium]
MSARSRALLGEERAALQRRMKNAERELDKQRAALMEHSNWLCGAALAAQRALKAANVDQNALSHLVRDLHDAIPAYEVEERSLRRATQWLAD